ncbi:Na/Pi cotransporter family protein [Candidatus Albibeggiatoa sp. nov. NOAA]|uniref:Na/Pi cotransporter family protein n=1 Tax=Candidatus Albibeggiatoa sp. nov. NOAA TaxID=3162724 RepID=UPI0032F62D28|nr:Na/Pi cotransporter family protein [Thiotrichaceae bacterium]
MLIRSPHSLLPINIPIFIILSLALTGGISAAVAGEVDTSSMPWGEMAMGLFGGLALFLFGMEMMANGLKAVAGERLQTILAHLTSNRFFGAITGAFVTAVIQSSSVTTVLVVGFVATNIMSLSQAIGVIMGANIGTTVTAQIVAFKVTKYALLMIAMGFALQFFAQHKRVTYYGNILMGLGLIFFGMSVMGSAMKPLQNYEPFLQLMVNMENPLLGIAVAAIFTALVQSSSATTGIIIVMASQGFVTLPAGIALTFGANIGTCVTALLAAIGKPREAVRAAVVHILFNVCGVLLWIGFIDHFAQFVAYISPVAVGLSGTEKLAVEAPRQIANANTIFNIANTLIFIGFTRHFALLVYWLVPNKPTHKKPKIKPKHLDTLLLENTPMALAATRRELQRMSTSVDNMLVASMPMVLHGNKRSLKTIAKMDNEVDILYKYIVHYLGEMNKRSLNQQESSELSSLLEATNSLESIGDVIETNLVYLGKQRIKHGIEISQETQDLFMQVHSEVAKVFQLAMEAVIEKDVDKAQQVLNSKETLNYLIEEATLHQAQRLTAQAANRPETYSLEVDILEKLRWIHHSSRRMAKSVFHSLPNKT